MTTQHRARRANYLIIFAFACPVIMAMVTLTVDGARVFQAQQELKMASDSHAHAALLSMRTRGTTPDKDAFWLHQVTAQKVTTQNTVDGKKARIHNRHAHPGIWDFERRTFKRGRPSNAVQAYAGMARGGAFPMKPMKPLFGGFLGKKYLNVMADSASVAAIQPRDVVLAMDVSGSFAGEMPQARKSAIALLDAMKRDQLAGNRLGLTVFSGDAELFTPLQDTFKNYRRIKDEWLGTVGKKPKLGPNTKCNVTKAGNVFRCKGPQWVAQPSCHWWQKCFPKWEQTTFTVERGLTWCDNRRDEKDRKGTLFAFTASLFGVSHWATDMPSCGYGGGGTNHVAAIESAWDELALNGLSYSKASIVLLSDGSPTAPWRDMQGDVDFKYNRFMSHTDMIDTSKRVAQNACAKGIDIYAVSFSDGSPSARAAQDSFMNGMVCGSGTLHGTNEKLNLPRILDEIGRDVPVVFVQ